MEEIRLKVILEFANYWCDMGGNQPDASWLRILSGDSIVFLREYVLTWYIHLLAWTRYIVLESKHNNMLLWYVE